ncbi:MAG: GlyGly-CTERM sorting domain-containing protein [Gammaproteobacteria bacterium]|nr:GlyGly-CTERM sorting domain-containing protein [Gammaproteobacteria bacterium]
MSIRLPITIRVGNFLGVRSTTHRQLSLNVSTLLVGACLSFIAPLAQASGAQSTAKLLAIAEPQRGTDLPITQLIVRFRDDVAAGRLARPSLAKLESLSSRAGGRLAYRRPTADFSHVLRLGEPLPRADAERVAQRLRLDPAIASVEIDEYVFPFLTPTDPFWTDSREVLWHLKAPTVERPGGANLPEAWDTSTGRNVVVAVIDSGITTHLDLDTNIIRGHDFISGDNGGGFLVANDGDGRDADPADPGDWIDDNDLTKTVFSGGSSPCTKANSSWHGTHVAGTVGAVTGNNAGVVGIAHEGKVLVVRALGKCFGYGSDITDAIRWAAGAQPASGTWPDLGIPVNASPARVINLSLGSTSSSCSNSRQNAVTAARAMGAVVVAATGNNSRATISSPANCSGVIAVTAHTVEGDKASFANYGVGTTLSAPGGGSCTTSVLNCLPQGSSGATGTIWRLIASTTNDGTTTPGAAVYSGKSGTSMAAPHVSGVAALLISAMPTLTVDSVRNVLAASAREFPAGTFCFGKVDNPCGAGMLDAARAIQRLAALAPTVTAQVNAALVENGSTVTLSGMATPKAGGNTLFSLRWQQTAGATVTLSSATSAQTTFTAPNGSRMTFRLTATDGDGFSASRSVDVRSNGTPVLAALPAISASAGNTVSFRASATDPDNDPLTYSAAGLPSGATLSAGTGEFSWPNATAGTFTVTVTASDGLVTSAPQSVSITVTASRGGGGSLDLWTLLMLIAALAWRRSLRPNRTT